MKKYVIPYIITLSLQIFTSDILSIKGVSPDFIIIFLVYFALNQGSFRGVVVGFTTGLILSIFDNSPILGILPLTYSIVGYGIGFLSTRKSRFSPLKFNIICYSIVVFGFFIYNYFLFDTLFYNDFTIFLLYWLKNTIYTITLLGIFQFIYPFKKQ